MATNVLARLHYYIIVVYPKMGREAVESLKWDNMTFEQRTKWDWYFKYRAALLQIKYPRYHIDCRWGSREMTKDEFESKKKRDTIIGKKRIISKWENKLAAFVSNWNEIFPVEQDIRYKNAVEKINQKKKELQDLLDGNYQIDSITIE